MSWKNYFKFLLFLNLVFFGRINSQTCGGSFGAPIFIEDFGRVNNSFQTISPALVPPAFTNYIYSSTFPPNDGRYTISNTTEYLSWGWQKSLDHTNDPSGTYGNMLVVNADYTPGEFYRRRVSNLCPNQTYLFSAWILNIHRAGANIIKPNVTFQIRSTSGAIIKSFSTGDLNEENGEVWKNFSTDFKSDPSSSEVDVVLINNSPGGNGNDLAIDDISFSPCGPSTSITSTLGNIFTTGVCDNSQNFILTAQMSANTFLNVNYIWQKSSDGGNTWINLTGATSNPNITIPAGSYQNNDQFRFIVGEAANINLTSCRVMSGVSTVKINGYPSAPSNRSFSFCKNSTATLTIPENNILWYTSATGGVGSINTPIIDTSVVGTKDFWITQTVNGCESARAKISVNILDNPSAPIVSNYEFCQNSTAASLSAVGTDLKWYTSLTGGTGDSVAPIPNTSIAGDFSFWVSQTVNGCESERTEVKVKILQAPFSTVLKDTSICDGENIVLDVGVGFIAEWQTVPPIVSQTLQVSSPGQYSVKLTDSKGCVAIQTVNVNLGVTPVITQVKSGEDFLEIIAENGNPPYFYSLDNVNWQTSNIFKNLSAGIYQVYVKSQVNSCTAVATSAVLFIPNAFTPNQDGYNDVWKVSNIEFFSNVKLKIFDRYGTQVFTAENLVKFNWDGLYNGRLLPSGTYWYVLEIDGHYTRTGWILLKNR
ncbi:T9SS type B sorting domain-containing protein [Cloacibacterium sp. TD35]|uniref:T9SS type B sorting domain-containing protein n=1 Tax=Cloacibacterium sp. TD35 TaxID=2976818 RepID=UPI00237D4CEC|nr:T9SS type B sorting domain-containing protein [Cloacibacterium sp. TD35]WDT68280.1 T9SS type B sorting domain-containing protein [Cloacibacterium sp. TD35]